MSKFRVVSKEFKGNTFELPDGAVVIKVEYVKPHSIPVSRFPRYFGYYWEHFYGKTLVE